jgi:hypothetical protein
MLLKRPRRPDIVDGFEEPKLQWRRSHSSVSSSATHSTNHVRLLILIGLIEGIDS